MQVRPTEPNDIAALQTILDATGLFPAGMLPGMLSPFLNNETNEACWLTCEHNGDAIGFCYAIQEQLTEGTWNMLAIAVLPGKQGSGAGKAMLSALEDRLRDTGQRILIVDTSSTAGFAQTRKFYRKNGYTEEARIRDFWAPGDDKIIFWKKL